MRGVWSVESKKTTPAIATIKIALTVAALSFLSVNFFGVNPALADTCDAGSGGSLGNFLAIESLNANGKDNEAKLAALSDEHGLGRAAEDIDYLDKVEIPDGSEGNVKKCHEGEKGIVDVRVTQTKVDDGKHEGIEGDWKSTSAVCFVVVKASNSYAIYEYPDGATSGTWTTSKLDPHGVSHIQFYTCTPGDAQKGTLVLKKKLVNETDQVIVLNNELIFLLGYNGHQVDASFSGNLSANSYSEKFADGSPFSLTPAEYTISEGALPNAPDGTKWSGDAGIFCAVTSYEGDTPGSVIDGAKVNLAADEEVTCTVTNILVASDEPPPQEEKGEIIVRKEGVGGSGSFDFVLGNETITVPTGSAQSFTKLTVGETYKIYETKIDGWELQQVSCESDYQELTDNGELVGVEVKLDKDSVACTFINFKEKDDKMEDVTKVFIHRRVDNLLTHGPDRARLLRRLEEQQQPGSLKDYEPLKLVGSMFAGLVGSRAVEEPDIGPGGTGMIASGPFGDPDHETDNSFTRSRVGGFGSAAFSQLGRGSGSSDFSLPAFKFSTSLSELRMAMQAIEAKKEEEKARLMSELGFGGQAYTRPITGARQGLDIWVEGQMSRYDDSTGGIRREGDFKILYVGADYALTPGILVGTLVQFDFTNEDVKEPDLTGSVDGRGWMAGPYIGIKLTDHLVFDARAAWGTSDNDIELEDDAGWRKGSFDTTRWLATASLTGNWYYGAWRLTPQVSLAYGHEEYDTYKNSLGQTVDGAGISIGRATFGTEVGYRIMTSDGTLVEPHLGISGIWNFDSDDLVINGAVVETNKSRAKLDGGILVRRQDGMGLRAAVSYDGIGESDFEAWSGQVWLNLPLN